MWTLQAPPWILAVLVCILPWVTNIYESITACGVGFFCRLWFWIILILTFLIFHMSHLSHLMDGWMDGWMNGVLQPFWYFEHYIRVREGLHGIIRWIIWLNTPQSRLDRFSSWSAICSMHVHDYIISMSLLFFDHFFVYMLHSVMLQL